MYACAFVHLCICMQIYKHTHVHVTFIYVILIYFKQQTAQYNAGFIMKLIKTHLWTSFNYAKAFKSRA